MMGKPKVIQALENCIGCLPCKNVPFDRWYRRDEEVEIDDGKWKAAN